MFFRNKYSLNRIRDKIIVREGNEEIELKIDSDVNSLMSKLIKAQKRLSDINAESSEEERMQAAKELSVAMFGEEQTLKLAEFYSGDYDCVVAICGMYFSDKKNGLSKKIAKVQKRIK